MPKTNNASHSEKKGIESSHMANNSHSNEASRGESSIFNIRIANDFDTSTISYVFSMFFSIIF